MPITAGRWIPPHRPLQPNPLRPQPTHDDRLLSAALVAELGRAPVYDFTVNHVVLPGHPSEMVRSELLRRAAVRATAGGGSVG